MQRSEELWLLPPTNRRKAHPCLCFEQQKEILRERRLTTYLAVMDFKCLYLPAFAMIFCWDEDITSLRERNLSTYGAWGQEIILLLSLLSFA